jgi:DNA repair protein RadA/Sms
MEARLKEAAKLGFGRALGPLGLAEVAPFPVTGVSRLAEAVRRIGEDVWD